MSHYHLQRKGSALLWGKILYQLLRNDIKLNFLWNHVKKNPKSSTVDVHVFFQKKKLGY